MKKRLHDASASRPGKSNRPRRQLFSTGRDMSRAVKAKCFRVLEERVRPLADQIDHVDTEWSAHEPTVAGHDRDNAVSRGSFSSATRDLVTSVRSAPR